MGILRKRCRDQVDSQLVDIIERLHLRQWVTIGDEKVELKYGVAQGSVLAPFLFNVYLEETINSSPQLSQMARRGDLKAYADDILAQLDSAAEALAILSVFDKVEQHWNLKLNKKKCEILAFKDES